MPLPPFKKNHPPTLISPNETKEVIHPAKDRFLPSNDAAEENIFHTVLAIEAELNLVKRALLHHDNNAAQLHLSNIYKLKNIN